LKAQAPDIIVAEPTPDINFQNMEIKYLRQALASGTLTSPKAEVYSKSLAKCDFNTTLGPHSITSFGLVGNGQQCNCAEEVRHFKINSNTTAE